MKKKEKERLIYIISNGILKFNGSNYGCDSISHCNICKFKDGSCHHISHIVFTPEYTDEYINELKQSNPEWFI